MNNLSESIKEVVEELPIEEQRKVLAYLVNYYLEYLANK